MAEVAPLTAAHAHARKAAKETDDANWPAAGKEYQCAADDFARAAKSTTDNEALRVLRLLENHHHHIARIIQSRDISPHTTTPSAENLASPELAAKEDGSSSPAATDKVTPGNRSKAPTPSIATAASRIGSHARDTSPSLAREIASRRGIPLPGGRTVSSPAAQARTQPQQSPDSHRRTRAGLVNPRIPPSIMDSQADIDSMKRSKKLEEDEGFARFYSNITTGTMSKLTAALAFAGLPLTSDDSHPEPATDQRSSKKRVPANNDPDVKKIFSKAALDAVAKGHGFGPAESFYLVPGTKSYADIAKIQQQQQHQQQQQQSQLSSIGEDDDEAFVDAREVLGPPSPRHSRRPSARQVVRGSFGKARTPEELELENATLKEVLQNLTDRLGVFEAHAQDASMAELTRSIASLRGAEKSAAQLVAEERVRELEVALQKKTQEEESARTKSTIQEKTLKKWEKKFETLKTSAKEKDKAKRESQAAAKDGFDETGAAAAAAEGLGP